MALNYGLIQKKLQDLYFKIETARTDEQTSLLSMWYTEAIVPGGENYDWASRMKQCNIWYKEYQKHVNKQRNS